MDKEIKCEELAEIKSFDTGRPNFQVLRVVRWNDGDPVIEKRWFFRLSNGQLKVGRSVGLNMDDLVLVMSKFDKIKDLVQNGEGIGQKI